MIHKCKPASTMKRDSKAVTWTRQHHRHYQHSHRALKVLAPRLSPKVIQLQRTNRRPYHRSKSSVTPLLPTIPSQLVRTQFAITFSQCLWACGVALTALNRTHCLCRSSRWIPSIDRSDSGLQFIAGRSRSIFHTRVSTKVTERSIQRIGRALLRGW